MDPDDAAQKKKQKPLLVPSSHEDKNRLKAPQVNKGRDRNRPEGRESHTPENREKPKSQNARGPERNGDKKTLLIANNG
jgi:hypothetical protein